MLFCHDPTRTSGKSHPTRIKRSTCPAGQRQFVFQRSISQLKSLMPVFVLPSISDKPQLYHYRDHTLPLCCLLSLLYPVPLETGIWRSGEIYFILHRHTRRCYPCSAKGTQSNETHLLWNIMDEVCNVLSLSQVLLSLGFLLYVACGKARLLERICFRLT